MPRARLSTDVAGTQTCTGRLSNTTSASARTESPSAPRYTGRSLNDPQRRPARLAPAVHRRRFRAQAFDGGRFGALGMMRSCLCCCWVRRWSSRADPALLPGRPLVTGQVSLSLADFVDCLSKLLWREVFLQHGQRAGDQPVHQVAVHVLWAALFPLRKLRGSRM